MSRFLITGGCGFIGSHLADALVSAGHQVRIIDNLSTGHRHNVSPECEIIEADIRDIKAVKAAMRNMDGCFHLAAIASVEQSRNDWIGTHQVNLGATVNILETARTCSPWGPIPVVYASSAAVYGDMDVVASEYGETRPLTAYGADKLGCEFHARIATIGHGVPTTGFRFFNVYGPRQDPRSPYSGVISIFIDRLLRRKSLTIYGTGHQVRDFVYVADIVNFLIAGMGRRAAHPRVFNACTGQATSIEKLALTIAKVLGETPEFVMRPARSGDITFSTGYPVKASLALDVRAETALIDGLRHTVEAMSETALAAE